MALKHTTSLEVETITTPIFQSKKPKHKKLHHFPKVITAQSGDKLSPSGSESCLHCPNLLSLP